MPTHNDYQVGWICALPLEFAAAEAMLDTLHETLPNRRDDENTYVFGSILQHNVVIACLPVGVYGTTSATSVGMQMRTSFPSLRFCLMVGVAGGAPAPHVDIRLGDVVVSKPTGGYGGVIQYDYGKAVEDGEFVLTGTLDKPPAVLLTALARLQAKHHLRGNDIHRFYKDALNKYGQLAETFSFPGRAGDVLFVPDYSHVGGGNNDCDNCDQDQIHPRPSRPFTHPRVFYGLVASANQVLRNAARRDALSRRHGILCFEMEAAGLIDIVPCLVIRGICDYCDSHKNKQRQGYASMTAACYAKELLSVIPSNEVTQTKTIKDGLSNTNNTLPTIPSDPIQTASKENAKPSYSEPINSGFGGPSMGNSHQTAVGVPLSNPQSVDIPVGKGNRLLIGIELGYQFSTAAWTTTADFRSYKINLITEWPGRSAETCQVPTELGYEDGDVFWGYSIPEDTRRVAVLNSLRHGGDPPVGNSYDGYNGGQPFHDYLAHIYRHIINPSREGITFRLVRHEVCVVVIIPSSFQSRFEQLASMAHLAIRSEDQSAKVKTVVRSKAVALGALCRVQSPWPGIYVICDSCGKSTDLNTYRLASVTLEEITDRIAGAGGWESVDKTIEDICRQQLKLNSVHVGSSDLRGAIMEFRENILSWRSIDEDPARKYYIDIRGILPNRRNPNIYTCEPYHICLTEAEIATAFTVALNTIETLINAQIDLLGGHDIRGIVLAGSLGSNPYVYQRIKSVYTSSYAIPVLQEPNYRL